MQTVTKGSNRTGYSHLKRTRKRSVFANVAFKRFITYYVKYMYSPILTGFGVFLWIDVPDGHTLTELGTLVAWVMDTQNIIVQKYAIIPFILAYIDGSVQVAWEINKHIFSAYI